MQYYNRRGQAGLAPRSSPLLPERLPACQRIPLRRCQTSPCSYFQQRFLWRVTSENTSKGYLKKGGRISHPTVGSKVGRMPSAECEYVSMFTASRATGRQSGAACGWRGAEGFQAKVCCLVRHQIGRADHSAGLEALRNTRLHVWSFSAKAVDLGRGSCQVSLHFPLIQLVLKLDFRLRAACRLHACSSSPQKCLFV